MEFIFCIGVLFLIIWALFIKGALFKIIIAFFAFVGMRTYLLDNFPKSHGAFITAMGLEVSWSTSIPIGIIILAMATTGVKK